MSRSRKPARLWLETARYDKNGKLTHNAEWKIRDIVDGKSKKIGTGCGASEITAAQRALSDYLVAQHSDSDREKHRHAHEVLIADILDNYVQAASKTIKRPRELAQRIGALLDFWGEKTLDSVDSITCGAYADSRTSQIMARRELEDLRSAIHLANRNRICKEAIIVTMPEKPEGRTMWMERETVAKILWAAYKKREYQTRHKGPDKGKKIPTKRRPTLHVARFILTALYTGSRASRVWQASFAQEEGRPWVDLENGLFYRKAPGEREEKKKKAPSIRIPGRLLAHLSRWHRLGAKYVVEYNGRAADPKRAFRTLVDDTLGENNEVVRHTLRHTAVTWLMQSGADKFEVGGFAGMSQETMEKVYAHHHPDYQKNVGDAFTTGRAGRGKKNNRDSLRQNDPEQTGI